MRTPLVAAIALALAPALAGCAGRAQPGQAATQDCCGVQIDNKTSFPIQLFANGQYKCTAQATENHPKDYCTASLGAGEVTLTAQWPSGKTKTATATVTPGKFLTWTITE